MDQIRHLLSKHARLRVSVEFLADDANLFAAGLDQAATINLMLAIEDEFGIRLPESLPLQTAFASVSSLRRTVETLT
jgi:acyl carrier protein